MNRKEIFIMDLASYSSEYKNGENIYICRDSKNKFELKIYSRYPGDMAFDITKIEWISLLKGIKYIRLNIIFRNELYYKLIPFIVISEIHFR